MLQSLILTLICIYHFIALQFPYKNEKWAHLVAAVKSTQFNFLYISWLKCFCIINQSFSEPELADKAMCTNRSKFKYSFFQFQQPQIMLRSTWMLRQTPLWHLIATLPALERTPLLVSMIVFLRPIWGLSSYFWFCCVFLSHTLPQQATHITPTGNRHHWKKKCEKELVIVELSPENVD